MAVRNYSLGQLNPICYFENSRGVIALPPSTQYGKAVQDRMKGRGFEIKYAGTLAEVDHLQKRMIQQEYQQQQRAIENDERMGARVHASVASRLYQRMLSSETSDYEKEFIRTYLRVREDKREKHRKKFELDQMYFEAREFDSNSKHMQDVVSRTPDSKDTECTRCHGNRRSIGTLCSPCANEVLHEAYR